MAQARASCRANDLGGTMFEESISKGAGAQNTDYLDPKEMQRVAEDIGPLCRARRSIKKPDGGGLWCGTPLRVLIPCANTRFTGA